MPFRWTRPPTQALSVAPYQQHLSAHVTGVLQRWAAIIQADMQTNAPWQDRSGLARRSLWAAVESQRRGCLVLRAGQGVAYGVYLEMGHAGRWAIVLPTLTRAYQPLWEDITR